MTVRTGALLLAIAGGLASITACSIPVCLMGTFPFDGATNVDPGVIIELRSFGLARDMPSLDGSLALLDLGTNQEVPVDIVVDPDTDTIFVTPDAALPDGSYTVREVGPRWSGLWHRSILGAPEPSLALTFEVGGAPTLLGAGIIADGAVLVLAFSEPVDAATVPDRLQLVPEVAFEGLGARQTAPTLVEVALLSEHDGAIEVHLDEGVLALDGTPVPREQTMATGQAGREIEVLFRGEAHCVL